MGANGLDEYWVPEHVKDYLRRLGFVLPLDDIEPWIHSWDDWMGHAGTSTTIATRTAWDASPSSHEEELRPILEAVSFANQIVFGQVHYDRRTSAYEDLDAFYREAACQVRTFCEENSIDCHIKKGTIRINLRGTEA